MMQESIGLIIAKIEELIIATGGGVKVFYPYVVREMILTGVIPLITLCVSIPLVIFGIKEGEKVTGKEGWWLGALIPGLLGILYSLLGFFINLSCLLNPHYHAVQRILEMGSSLIKWPGSAYY